MRNLRATRPHGAILETPRQSKCQRCGHVGPCVDCYECQESFCVPCLRALGACACERPARRAAGR